MTERNFASIMFNIVEELSCGKSYHRIYIDLNLNKNKELLEIKDDTVNFSMITKYFVDRLKEEKIVRVQVDMVSNFMRIINEVKLKNPVDLLTGVFNEEEVGRDIYDVVRFFINYKLNRTLYSDNPIDAFFNMYNSILSGIASDFDNSVVVKEFAKYTKLHDRTRVEISDILFGDVDSPITKYADSIREDLVELGKLSRILGNLVDTGEISNSDKYNVISNCKKINDARESYLFVKE